MSREAAHLSTGEPDTLPGPRQLRGKFVWGGQTCCLFDEVRQLCASKYVMLHIHLTIKDYSVLSELF